MNFITFGRGHIPTFFRLNQLNVYVLLHHSIYNARFNASSIQLEKKKRSKINKYHTLNGLQFSLT